MTANQSARAARCALELVKRAEQSRVMSYLSPVIAVVLTVVFGIVFSLQDPGHFPASGTSSSNP